MSQTSLFERVAGLEVQIDDTRRESREFPTPRWNRVSTVVTLRGGGVDGVGEDVSYDPLDQAAHMALPPCALRGRHTLAAWSELLDRVELVPEPLVYPESANYRRWAYEGALLDLALRQAGMSLADAFGRTPQPIRFCVSPTGDPMDLYRRFPDREMKVDASIHWTPDHMAELSATGRVRVVDLKAHYVGDWVERPDDPLAFSRTIAQAFPDAILEDPAIGRYMEPFHTENSHRTSFDAPVHSVEDLENLPPTRWCNIKPSRFGTIRRLLDCIEHCDASGIEMYGGGQFEIGPGRAQVQALASVFYPNGPNDVAPSVYNAAVLPDSVPSSPLSATTVIGFATHSEASDPV